MTGLIEDLQVLLMLPRVETSTLGNGLIFQSKTNGTEFRRLRSKEEAITLHTAATYATIRTNNKPTAETVKEKLIHHHGMITESLTDITTPSLCVILATAVILNGTMLCTNEPPTTNTAKTQAGDSIQATLNALVTTGMKVTQISPLHTTATTVCHPAAKHR